MKEIKKTLQIKLVAQGFTEEIAKHLVQGLTAKLNNLNEGNALWTMQNRMDALKNAFNETKAHF